MNPGEGKDESVEKRLFQPTGRYVRKGIEELKIVPIQPDEPIIHGIMRRAAHRWEVWGGTKKTALVLVVGAILYGLYSYFGTLVPIFVAIFLFVVIPYEYFEAEAEEKRDIIRVRVYRPEGRMVPMDVSLKKDKKLTIQVYKPSDETTSEGLKRKKYEEYYFARRLLDPTHPKGINTPHCRVIDTGYAKYIFAVDVDIAARTVVGEEDLIPAGVMIPLVEESISYINEGLKAIDKGLRKAKISPEDGKILQTLAENAKTAFYSFVTFAKTKDVDFLKVKDLNKAEQQYVFFMNRLSSKFFTVFRDLKDWSERTPSMRMASIQGIESMKLELIQVHKFYQAYEKDLVIDIWDDALDYHYGTSGMSTAAQKADQEERARQMREVRTKEEIDVTKEDVTTNA